MTQLSQPEKLQKVIERAVKNGWTTGNLYKAGYAFDEEGLLESTDEIIFNHEFCKAYFGEKEFKSCKELGHPLIDERGERNHIPDIHKVSEGWQYHIQQLALTPPSERIGYLYSFIDQNEEK